MKVLQPGTPWAEEVLRAAAILYDAGATAVWLFGSRTGERAADRLTDFDLAIEDLPCGNGAVAQALRELKGRADIVQLESAPPALRWGIARSRIFVPWVALGRSESPSRPQLPDSLAGTRTRTVAQLIREIAPRSVIDFGCGHGLLLAELAGDVRLERLTGVDFDLKPLAGAQRRIARALGPRWRERVDLREGLITHRDSAFLGHEAAAAIEVVEHLESPQLHAFVGVMFDFVRPSRVVLTTPNSEYNVVWDTRRLRGYRHPEHRFEWSRIEFVEWASKVATSYGYKVRVAPVGSEHPVFGPPTQLAVFDKCN